MADKGLEAVSVPFYADDCLLSFPSFLLICCYSSVFCSLSPRKPTFWDSKDLVK